MMACRICVIFGLILSAMAHQGGVETVVNALGDAESMDTVSMLQKPGMTDGAQIQGAQAHGVLAEVNAKPKTSGSSLDVKFQAVLAEYIAMTLFIVIGPGSALGVATEPGWVLQVALTFGFAISSLAYAIGHYSGGQINCAVTLGLVLSGNLSLSQAICNVLAQLLGSITGACILTLMCPEAKDKTKALFAGLFANSVQEGYTVVNALFGEGVMTFLLMFVVLETGVNPATSSSRAVACLAIGFAVFLAHSVLIPITGCSINPTRSFGPAVVAQFFYKDADTFKDMWVFCVGPLAGAAGAALVYSMLNM